MDRSREDEDTSLDFVVFPVVVSRPLERYFRFRQERSVLLSKLFFERIGALGIDFSCPCVVFMEEDREKVG